MQTWHAVRLGTLQALVCMEVMIKESSGQPSESCCHRTPHPSTPIPQAGLTSQNSIAMYCQPLSEKQSWYWTMLGCCSWLSTRTCEARLAGRSGGRGGGWGLWGEEEVPKCPGHPPPLHTHPPNRAHLVLRLHVSGWVCGGLGWVGLVSALAVELSIVCTTPRADCCSPLKTQAPPSSAPCAAL